MTWTDPLAQPGEMKDRIRQIRKANHFSQVEFAKKLAVSQSVISLIESGQASVSVEILKRLSSEFDVSCDWLIYGQNKYVRLSLENNFVPLVSMEAEAGYISNYHNPEYPATLDLYKIPGFENGDFRIFVVDGDSMSPTIHPNDKIVSEKLKEGVNSLVEGTINVVVTKTGIMVKRVYHWDQDRRYIILKSDNRHYTEERIAKKNVKEMWAVRAKITSSFVDETYSQNERMDALERDLTSIKTQVQQLLQNEPMEDRIPAVEPQPVFQKKKNK